MRRGRSEKEGDCSRKTSEAVRGKELREGGKVHVKERKVGEMTMRDEAGNHV